MTDSDYMRRALDLAERGRGTTSPNPMVGAVIVDEDGVIVGQGFHERTGGPHAETRALDEAGARARGATLYCTLEPCSHVGRTGPCAERVTAAGIRRVFASSEDPNPLVSGRGFDFLRRHGVEVSVGIERQRALQMNRSYRTYIRERRPFVIVKAATSLDNCISARPGVRTTISSEESQRHAQSIRAEVDAIAVGSETVLVDDPLLTVRHLHRGRPLTRVVFDRRLRVSAAARVFSTLASGPIVVVTTAESIADNPDRARGLERAGAVLDVSADGDLRASIRRLGDREITSLVLEGGTVLQRAAFEAGLVDAVHLYVAPVVLGAGGLPWLDTGTVSVAALADRRVEPCGPDVFMDGYVHGVD